MFQNIVDEEKEENISQEDIRIDKKENIKNLLKKLFTKQNILVYILSFMLSMVSGINGMAPFGLAIFAAALSNAVPAGIIYFLTLIRYISWIWNANDFDISFNITFICSNDINL